MSPFSRPPVPGSSQPPSEINGGTCVSMPVLYTAVARRLGYPVKLVTTKAHVFCRWDGPSERVNVEATNRGMNSFDDAYYTTWPMQVSSAEIEADRLLESLSPARELALFMATRGHNLLDTHRLGQAEHAYSVARRLAPDLRLYRLFLADATQRTNPQTLAARQQRPLRMGDTPFGRQVYDMDPFADLQKIISLNQQNRRMMETRRPNTVAPTPIGYSGAHGQPWPGQPTPPQPGMLPGHNHYGTQPPNPYPPSPNRGMP